MKVWLFALLQAGIAVLGLAGYFLADNWIIASAAAFCAAVLGIAQPLLAAHKERKLAAYQDQQFQRSVDAVDEQLQSLADEVIAPPLPHRPTVAAMLQRRQAEQAPEWLSCYDLLADAIETGHPQAAGQAAQFSEKLCDSAAGAYLQGLAAMGASDLEAAHGLFTAATEQQPAWIAPWLGWAATAARLGRWDEISQNHPHINGVELLPYDAGDEDTFLQMADTDRQVLCDQYQRAATGLGNYYTIAELQRSKRQMAASREEFRKAA